MPVAVTVMVLATPALTTAGMRAVTVTATVPPRTTFEARVGVTVIVQPGRLPVAPSVKLSRPLPVLVSVWVKVSSSPGPAVPLRSGAISTPRTGSTFTVFTAVAVTSGVWPLLSAVALTVML